MNKVVGMGEALWDCLPDGRKLGGAPANFAYHVSQFGLEGCVVSAVGADLLGREITDIFTEKRLAWNIPTVEYPTGTVQVLCSSWQSVLLTSSPTSANCKCSFKPI